MNLRSHLVPMFVLVGAALFGSCKTTDHAGGTDSGLEAASLGMLRDGCYGLANPGISGGVVCLGGVNKAGRDGKGIKAAYGTQTSSTSWCGVSTGTRLQGDEKVALIFGPSKITFDMANKKIIIGSSTYGYFGPLSHLKSSDMFSSDVCKRAFAAAESGEDSDTGIVIGKECQTYIESCPGNKRPVTCPNSYYCIDEIPGRDYPQCVARDKLVDGYARCNNTDLCVKCP